MNPQTWITQRQHRAQLSPAEWHAARLALTDQLAELDADAPVMLVNDRQMCSFMSHERLDDLVEVADDPEPLPGLPEEI